MTIILTLIAFDIRVTFQIKNHNYIVNYKVLFLGLALLFFPTLSSIDLYVLLFVRVPARLVVEEMQAVIYPMPLPLLGAETHTSRGDEKTGLKELKADKMETIESW